MKKKLVLLGMFAAMNMLQSSELIKNIRTFRATSLPSKNSVMAHIASEARGGFYQQNLNWDTSKIKQIEFSLMAKAPGYFQFACSTISGQKRTPVKLSPKTVIPAGEYHHYIFNVSDNANWRGVMTNWELRWIGEPGEIGINSIKAVTTVNRIANATGLKPDRENIVSKLMPRAKCRLRWEGGKSPGVTLRFYNRDLQEIKGTAVSLAKNEKEIEFTTPEMLVETRVKLHVAGEGFPVVQQLSYVSPSSTGNIFWRGKWIWSQKAPGPINRSIWFERIIELDEKPEFAVITKNVGYR